MAQINFDATQVAPQTSFTPIPAGIYIAQITESEIKATKTGTGQMLNTTWNIVDGQLAGRKVFGRINIQNQNPEAQKIGQSQLSQLCHAAGVLRLQDTAQLHNKPMKIKIKIRKDDTYGDSNEITAYEAVAGAVPMPQQGFAPAPFTAPAAPAQTSAPWGHAA